MNMPEVTVARKGKREKTLSVIIDQYTGIEDKD